MSKEKIFALLSAQAGDFVSGEDISAQLGISRAAVWKAVGALRRDGYTIEAQTGLGYRLADSPDVLSERELRRRLGETKIVGHTLDCFESVDSTNSYLKRIAAEGAPDGAVAVADEQTAGRGRRGRSFSSGPGRGVYLSALLRPQLAPEKILPLTALGAVAACDAVERTCGVRPQIKWTNDLVLNSEFRGKMEALAGVRSYLQGIRQDYVVLSDSDLIINLPLADVFAAHLESGADITAVCTANGGFVDNATYLTLESDGAIGQVWCAPTTPRGHRSLEIYILSKQLLLTLVDECSAQDKYSFRRDVLAGMTGRLKLRSYVWDGYAAQLRSVQEYYDRSMELLQGSIRAELFAAARPILAKEDDEASSYFAPGSRVKNSLVADGCTIEGSVENCILFPGVTVEKGAELRDSILFKGTRVRDGVTLRYVITDKYVEVLPGRTLMGHESYPIVISKGSIV